jgi:hypothetical protein
MIQSILSIVQQRQYIHHEIKENIAVVISKYLTWETSSLQKANVSQNLTTQLIDLFRNLVNSPEMKHLIESK